MEMKDCMKKTLMDVYNWLRTNGDKPEGHGTCMIYPVVTSQNELIGASLWEVGVNGRYIDTIRLMFDKNDSSVINGRFFCGDEEIRVFDMNLIEVGEKLQIIGVDENGTSVMYVQV